MQAQSSSQLFSSPFRLYPLCNVSVQPSGGASKVVLTSCHVNRLVLDPELNVWTTDLRGIGLEMTPRTIVFAIGMTAVAAFFGVMGAAAFVARGWDGLSDGVFSWTITAVLVWGIVLMVGGGGEEEQRGFEVQAESEREESGEGANSRKD